MMKSIMLVFIKFYKYAMSPYLPMVCRYYPSCSSYAYEAISKYGVINGGYLAIKRILRCHPFIKGGYDPVPGDCPVPGNLSMKSINIKLINRK